MGEEHLWSGEDSLGVESLLVLILHHGVDRAGAGSLVSHGAVVVLISNVHMRHPHPGVRTNWSPTVKIKTLWSPTKIIFIKAVLFIFGCVSPIVPGPGGSIPTRAEGSLDHGQVLITASLADAGGQQRLLAMLGAGGESSSVPIVREAAQQTLLPLVVQHRELLVIDAVLLPDVLPAVHRHHGPLASILDT